MLHHTRAIVLHYLRYRDTSIIARCYTEAFGAQSYLVNSVRTAKGGSKIAYYQPLTLLDMVVYHKPTTDLQHVSQVQFHDASLMPSPDMHKSSIRMFLAEVFSRVLSEPEPSTDKFAFLFTSMQAFEHAEQHLENFHIQCLLGLAKRLGFGSADASALFDQLHTTTSRFANPSAGLANETELTALQALMSQPYFTHVPMPSITRRFLLDTVVQYYRKHIDGLPEPKSLAILHTLFA